MATARYRTEASRWTAVRARDPAADGVFVYSVKTTKIFCRPTCKARLARRSNVDFYDHPEEAIRDGFRACKRCKPELESFVPQVDRSIDKIRLFLEKLPEDAPLPKLEMLAGEAGLTKFHFHRSFKKAIGMTPREYALSRRQNRGCATLLDFAADDLVCPTGNPSSVYDSTATAALPTPDTLPSAEIHFDDWLADGTQETSFVNDVHLGLENDVGTFFDKAVKFALSYDIYYLMTETTGGVVVMAWQDEQICKMELVSTPHEAVGSLEESFPTCLYVHMPADILPDEKKIPMQMRIAAVAEALELPMGIDTAT